MRGAAEAVDDELLLAYTRELVEELRVARRRLVDEHVLSRASALLGVEDLLAQDGRNERRVGLALAADRRLEERRHDVVVAARQLGAHEGLGELVVELRSRLGELAELAAADDLLVVDRDDGQAVALAEEVRERVEVADHRVGPELSHRVEVRADVRRPACRARRGRSARGSRRGPAVVDVADRQPADLDDVAERLGQHRVSPPADDDLHVVTRGDQVLADHLAPRGVAHPLADDAVQDPHARQAHNDLTLECGSTR